MVTLSFPALQNALLKNHKDLKEDDPRKGIIVFENNAIVVRDEFYFVVNLYDYFTIEYDITEEQELKDLDMILFYMNGKVFNAEFWKELTKGANMQIKQGRFEIDSPKYSKDLLYKEIHVDLLEPLATLLRISKQPENLISCIGLPFNVLKTIYSCMSNDFKNDVILLEFSSQDRPVKFTFKKRKHCFGYIVPDYNSTQEGFRFDTFQQFIGSDFVAETIEELRKNVAPPPPNSASQETANKMVAEANEEEDNGQTSILDHVEES